MIVLYRFSKPLVGIVFNEDQKMHFWDGMSDPVRCLYHALIDCIDQVNVVPAKSRVLVYNADGQIETVYYDIRFSEGDTT